MTRHATIKRLFQAAAIVAIGGLAGAAHAANQAGFLFFSRGPEQPYSISNGARASTGAGVCNSLGAGIDVRTITPFTVVSTDILAQCANGTNIQRHKDGSTTGSSTDNILWCPWPGGALMQGGVAIF